jgi:hypothetical protein
MTVVDVRGKSLTRNGYSLSATSGLDSNWLRPALHEGTSEASTQPTAEASASPHPPNAVLVLPSLNRLARYSPAQLRSGTFENDTPAGL